MSKLTYKASYYALYAMFAIILIVMGIFFFGGDATGDAVIPGVDPEMWQPAQTDALLYLMYVLFGLAVAATIIAAVFQFGAALKGNTSDQDAFGQITEVAAKAANDMELEAKANKNNANLRIIEIEFLETIK